MPTLKKRKTVGWNKRSGSTNRQFLLQYKEQATTSVLKTTDKKAKNLQQRFKVNIDSGANLGYVPFLFGGTAAFVPPYLTMSDTENVNRTEHSSALNH